MAENPRRHRKPWSQEEIEELKVLIKQNTPVDCLGQTAELGGEGRHLAHDVFILSRRVVPEYSAENLLDQRDGGVLEAGAASFRGLNLGLL